LVGLRARATTTMPEASSSPGQRPALVIVVPLEEAPHAHVIADTFGAELRMLEDALGRSSVGGEVGRALAQLVAALVARRDDAHPGNTGRRAA
jgi:hypothetical protein